MDLDPFVPAGITASTMRFLDAFLLHCLLQDSPHDTLDEMAELARNQHRTAAFGREPGLTLERHGRNVLLTDWAAELLAEIAPVAAALDAAHGCSAYADAVAAAQAAGGAPDTLPSARALAAMQRDFTATPSCGRNPTRPATTACRRAAPSRPGRALAQRLLEPPALVGAADLEQDGVRSAGAPVPASVARAPCHRSRRYGGLRDLAAWPTWRQTKPAAQRERGRGLARLGGAPPMRWRLHARRPHGGHPAAGQVPTRERCGEAGRLPWRTAPNCVPGLQRLGGVHQRRAAAHVDGHAQLGARRTRPWRWCSQASSPPRSTRGAGLAGPRSWRESRCSRRSAGSPPEDADAPPLGTRSVLCASHERAIGHRRPWTWRRTRPSSLSCERQETAQPAAPRPLHSDGLRVSTASTASSLVSLMACSGEAPWWIDTLAGHDHANAQGIFLRSATGEAAGARRQGRPWWRVGRVSVL